MKKLSWLAWVLLVLAACGGDDDKKDDGDSSVNLMDGSGDDEGGDGTECRAGIPCTPNAECAVAGYECQPQQNFGLGGVDDPIEGYPAGADTEISAPFFEGGYCSPSRLREVSADPEACTPGEDCDGCSRCLLLADDIAMCLANCTPSVQENDCAGSNACLTLTDGSGICLSGCTSDDECHVARVDSNDNGTISADEGDGLKYFADGFTAGFVASCDETLNVCRHTGTQGAEAGDPCIHDFECEANGACVDGRCTKFDCDLEGNDCAGAGVCVAGQCVQGCTVGDHVGDDPLAPHATCPEGNACVPTGDGTAGGCQPGNFNDVAVNNLGAGCVADADCYSPYGLGSCLFLQTSSGASESGICAIDDCSLSSIVSDACGEDSFCAVFNEETGFDVCLRTCADADACSAGHACVPVTEEGDSVCLNVGCETNAECSTGVCNTTTGVCQQTCTDADDCDAAQACVAQQGGGSRCLYECEEDDECQAGRGCNAQYLAAGAGGTILRVGTCTASCANNDACPAERICAPGNATGAVDVCTTICSEAGQCRAGEACNTVNFTEAFSIGSCDETCTTAADCDAGQACRVTTTDDGSVCSFSCTDSGQCRDGETCEIPTNETEGTCEAAE